MAFSTEAEQKAVAMQGVVNLTGDCVTIDLTENGFLVITEIDSDNHKRYVFQTADQLIAAVSLWARKGTI